MKKINELRKWNSDHTIFFSPIILGYIIANIDYHVSIAIITFHMVTSDNYLVFSINKMFIIISNFVYIYSTCII